MEPFRIATVDREIADPPRQDRQLVPIVAIWISGSYWQWRNGDRAPSSYARRMARSMRRRQYRVVRDGPAASGSSGTNENTSWVTARAPRFLSCFGCGLQPWSRLDGFGSIGSYRPLHVLKLKKRPKTS
jgi:hypothetical protein